MGKSSKSKQEVTKYFMSEHLGVCAGADAVLAIYGKEKLAWSGEETTLTSIIIEKDQLFGGRLKEGGMEGVAYWLPGDSAQVLPDVLAQKIGRSGGTDAPGYRGLASVWFVGPVGTDQAGHDWNDDKIAGSRGFYWTANNPYLPPVWVKVRRAPVGLDPDFALVPALQIAAEGLSGEVELTWWQTVAAGDDDLGQMGISFEDENGSRIGAIDYAALQNPAGWTERTHTATCPAGTHAIRIHMHMSRGDPDIINSAYIDDITATLDGLPLTIINPGAEDGTGGIHTGSSPNNPKTPGWRNDHGYLGSGSPGSSISPHSGSRWFYGGVSGNCQASQVVGIGAADAFDANPAHIIYECLTNTDWGMGSPETAIDKINFEGVAITLYNEGFGLSMIWTRQASIQDFIQEVLDHINAVVFVDPATGLLTLKLIRGDYEAELLPVVSPDNASLSNFSRKLWGEIANEIVVTWTNPANEQDETVTMQDLASIANQGGIISDSRNYYGVRNALLAAKLAQRDLRSAGAPLAACTAQVDRTQWQLRPASVVTLLWPEYGLDGVVMRAMGIDYGRPGDPTITLDLIEDVFGLDFGDYVEPPSTGWVDPSEEPEPLTIERIFTLPFFMAASSDVAEFVDDPVYPEVVAGILGTTDQEDAFAYDLWDEVTLSNGSLEWQNLGTNNIIGHGELAADIAAEAMSTPVSFANLIGDTSPTVAGFVIIGDDGDEGNEIAQVDDLDYTLRRGVLDTVPRAWPAATPVWFVDEETAFGYPAVLSAGETLDVKLLTRTSRGTLALGDAALVSETMIDRPWLPSRPANVTIDSVLFNTVETPVDMIGETEVPVTWANRNRLTEDSQVLSWTDATVTPETDQTTKIEIYGEDGTTLITTHTGLTGTSYNVPVASFGSEAVGLAKVWAERSDGDGDFVSLQAHGIWVQVGDLRITEDGEARETEDGEIRALEG